MSSVERYLKQAFERRQIRELQGSYTGPKKVKASGKAVGTKKKKTKKSGGMPKVARSSSARDSKSKPNARSNDGFAAPRRRKPQDSAD